MAPQIDRLVMVPYRRLLVGRFSCGFDGSNWACRDQIPNNVVAGRNPDPSRNELLRGIGSFGFRLTAPLALLTGGRLYLFCDMAYLLRIHHLLRRGRVAHSRSLLGAIYACFHLFNGDAGFRDICTQASLIGRMHRTRDCASVSSENHRPAPVMRDVRTCNSGRASAGGSQLESPWRYFIMWLGASRSSAFTTPTKLRGRPPNSFCTVFILCWHVVAGVCAYSVLRRFMLKPHQWDLYGPPLSVLSACLMYLEIQKYV